MHRIRPPGMIRSPTFRPPPQTYQMDKPRTKPKHWYLDRFKPPAQMSGDGFTLYDYYKIGDMVKQLPTIQEKINFVNPYERGWSTGEKRWHRAWLADLFEPRRAWAVPPTPTYYDTLNFYKYITKSRVFDGAKGRAQLDAYYNAATSPQASEEIIRQFESRLSETLRCFLSTNTEHSLALEVENTKAMALTNALQIIFEDLFLMNSISNSHASELRITHTPRCESFWICAGFSDLYKEHKIYYDEIEHVVEPLIGDNRRKRGELSFTMRDYLTSHARSIQPIRNLFDWSNEAELYAPVFDEPMEKMKESIIFEPSVYQLSVDSGILWQCPGYEADTNETHKFGVLAFKDASALHERLAYWQPDSSVERDMMRREFYTSTSLMSLFNWLNGQAHCTGFTQYTDIEAPLTSQLIVSNGQEFCFAVAQLNTIAFNIEVEGFNNRHTNLCYVDGPYRLYDEYDESTGTFRYRRTTNNVFNAKLETAAMEEEDDAEAGELYDGFNPHVIRRLLQMAHNH